MAYLKEKTTSCGYRRHCWCII